MLIPLISLRLFYKQIIASKKTIFSYAHFLTLALTIYFYAYETPAITYKDAQQLILRLNSEYVIVPESLRIVYGKNGMKDMYFVTVELAGERRTYVVNPYTKSIESSGLEKNLWHYSP